jgi:hypothetical protein
LLKFDRDVFAINPRRFVVGRATHHDLLAHAAAMKWDVSAATPVPAIRFT